MQPARREIPDLIDYDAFPEGASPTMLFVPDIPEKPPRILLPTVLGPVAIGKHPVVWLHLHLDSGRLC